MEKIHNSECRWKKTTPRASITLHLSIISGNSFDFIFHPVSNSYVQNINLVWQETARVLKNGGTLISGFLNPLRFLFDNHDYRKGKFNIKYSIPYSDLTNDVENRFEKNGALLFGHTLEDQIQGQIEAGYSITGFYEDKSGSDTLLDSYICTFIATRAVLVK